jgi:hypothetical protein
VTGGGYRLDNGPTVLTMPDLLADAVAAVGFAVGLLCHVSPP